MLGVRFFYFLSKIIYNLYLFNQSKSLFMDSLGYFKLFYFSELGIVGNGRQMGK